MSVDTRVTTLERVLQQYIESSEKNLTSLSRGMEDFKDEMRVFKDEMKVFKDEMKVFKDEMKVFKDEMGDFKDEMGDFKDEVKVFKDEMGDFKDEMKVFKDEMGDFRDDMKRDRKEMNKQWGNLANKLGSLVEDIIAPGIGPALKKYFNTRLDSLGIHLQKFDKTSGLKGEFDVVATDENNVYLVEVKSSPDKEKMDYFKENKISRFRSLFPEYKSKKLIPIFAGLRFSEELIEYASKSGIFVLGFREWEYLDFLNFDSVETF